MDNSALATALPGIDVSHYQAQIDWPQVAASGTQFAYLKATQGYQFIDPMLKSHYAGAKAADLKIGLYHVFVAPPALANATHFLEVAKDYPADLPVWLDLEPGSVTDETAQVALAVAEYIDPLQDVCIYAGTGTILTFLTDGDWLRFGLAIAHYGVPAPNIGPWASWRFWQHSQTGEVPGIAGNVDLDWGMIDVGSAT